MPTPSELLDELDEKDKKDPGVTPMGDDLQSVVDKIPGGEAIDIPETPNREDVLRKAKNAREQGATREDVLNATKSDEITAQVFPEEDPYAQAPPEEAMLASADPLESPLVEGEDLRQPDASVPEEALPTEANVESLISEEVPEEVPAEIPVEDIEVKDRTVEPPVDLPSSESSGWEAFEDFDENTFNTSAASAQDITTFDQMEAWGDLTTEIPDHDEDPIAALAHDKAMIAAMDTAGRKVNFLARRVATGGANVLDLPVNILSLTASLSEGTTGFLRSAVPDGSILDTILPEISTTSPMKALQVYLRATKLDNEGWGSEEAMPQTARALLNSVYPDVLPESFFETGIGFVVEGATESALMAFSIVKAAKMVDNLDDVPPFLRESVKMAKEDPKRFLLEEGFSGASAALSSELAMQWAMDNMDNPEASMWIGLISGAAGGTLRNPYTMAKRPVSAISRHTGSVLTLVKSGIQKAAKSGREAIRGTVDSQTLDDLLANNVYANILGRVGNRIAGPDEAAIVKSMKEELEESPELMGMVEEMERTLNVAGPGSFDSDLARAQDVRDVTGVELTTGNVSSAGDTRGFTGDLKKVDTVEAIRIAQTNRTNVRKYFDRIFAKGDGDTVAAAEEVLRDAYNGFAAGAIEHKRAVEIALANWQNALKTNIPEVAEGFRAEYAALKAGMKQYVDDLYLIDPLNKIKTKTDVFQGILTHPEFRNPTTTATGEILRKAYGTALVETLKRKMGSNNFKPTSKITEELLTRISNGDIKAIQELPKQSRVIFFQDVDGMIKSLRKSAKKAKEDTSGGGADYGMLNNIIETTLDEWYTNLRAGGYGDAVTRRKGADNFYRDYMNGFFDPGNTHAGQLLKQNQPTLFAVKSYDALDALVESPDSVSKFLKFTDPTDPEGGMILADIKGTVYGDLIESSNLKLEEQTPSTFEAMRQALSSHIIHRASQQALRSPENPRSAVRNWMNERQDTLDQLPETQKILEEWVESPSFSTEAIAEAQLGYLNAEDSLKRLSLSNMFGPGGLRENALRALGDSEASKFVDEVFSMADPSGVLRKTFISEAVAGAIRVTDSGTLDPQSVEKFVEKYGRGLERVGGKEVLEQLAIYRDAAAIAKRSEVTGGGGINFNQEIDRSWFLDNAGKMWTNLRQSMAMGISHSWLFITQAGQEATKALQKLDKKSQDRMAHMYGTLIADTDQMQEAISLVNEIKNARTAAARKAGEEKLAVKFGSWGMPMTAPVTVVDNAVELGEVPEDPEEPEEPKEPSKYTVVDEDGTESEVVLGEPDGD